MSGKRTTVRPPEDAQRIPRMHDDLESPAWNATELDRSQTEPPGHARDSLTILEGRDVGRIFTLAVNEDVIWIGRDADCGVTLSEKGVSRRHARFLRSEGRLLLRDNGAMNGTFVNGRRVSEVELRPGDEIQLGQHVNMYYAHAYGAADRRDQHRSARERLLAERMYSERFETIATVVTGVAHEINTPLGVARTATENGLDLAKELKALSDDPEVHGIVDDLRESLRLVSRNLDRASGLVQSFKQLSTNQLCDDYVTCEIDVVVRECLDSLSVETSRKSIAIRTKFPENVDFTWTGFPGHLSQVITNLVQNSIRYAYGEDDKKGTINVRLSAYPNRFRLEFEDHGAGIAPDLLPRVFEPFVTTGRQFGAPGLGLAIARNIVTNLLSGEIQCFSTQGKGTRFVVVVPRVVPETPASSLP